MSDSSDPMDCSPPGSSVHGIFQAEVLEWGAIAFSETVFYSELSLLGAPKSLQMVTAAMKFKDAYSLEGKL